MNKKLTIFFASMLFVALQAAAQMQITGKVTSAEDGLPIPGVSVVVKGNTTIGTTTNIDGEYSLSVPESARVLIFSFVGMKTEEISINGQSTINVSMTTEALAMDEVVVVAYGTMTKEKLTGSVEVVNAEKLEKVPAASFQYSLQGNVAGLQMTSTDGTPGSNSQVRIRGIGSIDASSEPLYVIDGIPVENTTTSSFNFDNSGRSSSEMNTLNPNDIESVSVLKDASSTALYGARGANGVIIITTKSGKKGKNIINFSTQMGFSNPASKNILQPISADQYKELYIEGYVNDYHNMTEAEAIAQFESTYGMDFNNTANTNWLDEISRTGITQQYNLSARGGNDKITYFTSLSKFGQESHIIGTGFDRYTGRLNLGADVSDKLKITNNITFAYSDQSGALDGSAWSNPIYNSIFLPPVIPVYNDDGTYYYEHKNYGIMAGNNPVGMLSGDDERWLKTTRYSDNLSFSYDLLEDLTFKSAWGIDYIQVHDFEFRNSRYGDGRNVGGRIQEGENTSYSWIGTQTLNYQKLIANDHNINALLGYEASSYTRRELYAHGEGFPTDNQRTMASAANPIDAYSEETNYRFTSIFSRLNYTYKSRYNFAASYRRDGSSRFGVDERYGNFWSVGASWVLSNETFMSGLTGIIHNLKLQTSYGTSGNANIGNFASLGLYSYSGYEYGGDPGGAAVQIGNPILTWEKQKVLDIGVNIGLFSRIDASVTYFKRTNSDLLLDRPISLTVGSADPEITQNVAEMINKGLEIELNASILQGDLSWDLGFNISTLKNEITDLEEPLTSSYFQREEGHDYYEYYFYHWVGVNPADGTPQWYTDETKTTITSDYDEIERFYTGKSALPKAFGGLNTRLAYKGVTLSATASYSWGNWIYDDNARFYNADGRYAPRSTSLYAYENRWQNPGDQAEFPRFIWNAPDHGYTYHTTRYLYDGTYIRLRDVTLSYDLPKEWVNKIRLSSLRIFMKGSNLYTWTKDKDLYLDPEQAVNGISVSVQPALKTLTFGLDLSF